MHQLVITDGIVLAKRGVGEANVLVTLLTEKLGRVSASARSARLAKSKLRYGLEQFTHARFSLVRGKYEWKITGVVYTSRIPPANAPIYIRSAAGRIAKLLLRLVQGEEAEPQLYRCVADGVGVLSQCQTKEAVDNVEAVVVLLILHRLGYVPEIADLSLFLCENISDDLLARVPQLRKLIVRTINSSLEATGM